MPHPRALWARPRNWYWIPGSNPFKRISSHRVTATGTHWPNTGYWSTNGVPASRRTELLRSSVLAPTSPPSPPSSPPAGPPARPRSPSPVARRAGGGWRGAGAGWSAPPTAPGRSRRSVAGGGQARLRACRPTLGSVGRETNQIESDCRTEPRNGTPTEQRNNSTSSGPIRYAQPNTEEKEMHPPPKDATRRHHHHMTSPPSPWECFFFTLTRPAPLS